MVLIQESSIRKTYGNYEKLYRPDGGSEARLVRGGRSGQGPGPSGQPYRHGAAGKTKPTFTPHIDTGDFVVVVNAAQVQLTGRKLDNKFYYHHSGFPGGIKEISARKLLQKKPEDILRHAVRGMLPKNSLGRQLLKKLKIYAGGDHPHEAQSPAPFPWED